MLVFSLKYVCFLSSKNKKYSLKILLKFFKNFKKIYVVNIINIFKMLNLLKYYKNLHIK